MTFSTRSQRSALMRARAIERLFFQVWYATVTDDGNCGFSRRPPSEVISSRVMGSGSMIASPIASCAVERCTDDGIPFAAK
jgi:hypothetical protein